MVLFALRHTQSSCPSQMVLGVDFATQIVKQAAAFGKSQRPFTQILETTTLAVCCSVLSEDSQASERHINIKIPLRKLIASATFGMTF